MHVKTLVMVLAAGILAVAGCGGSATNTSQAPAQNSGSGTATATATPAASPTATAAPPTSNLKPADVSADKPVPAAELNAAFTADQNAWIGKEVTVVGNYHSHTTSTVSSGKIIRIDISDASGKKVAACTVSVEPTKEEVAERKDRKFKGKIKDAWFSQVNLEPCEMLK